MLSALKRSAATWVNVTSGWSQSELDLAWDFTTASTRSLTKRMVSARDQTLAAIAAGVPKYRVLSTEINATEHLVGGILSGRLVRN